MTDQEINEAVARKLGWVRIEADKTWFRSRSFDIEHGRERDYIVNETREKEVAELPDYCGDIKAAWEIVGKLNGGSLSWRNQLWEFHISGQRGENHHFMANTAPMAICLAFLKLS